MKRADSSGFSVMEALVAVAILAIALLPILALQTQVTHDAGRQKQIRADLTDQRSAMAILRDINPMRTPTGAIELRNAVSFSWRATPLTPIRPTIARNDATTTFDVALYRLTVDIRDTRNARVSRFTTDQLGWRQTSAAQQ